MSQKTLLEMLQNLRARVDKNEICFLFYDCSFKEIYKKDQDKYLNVEVSRFWES